MKLSFAAKNTSAGRAVSNLLGEHARRAEHERDVGPASFARTAGRSARTRGPRSDAANTMSAADGGACARPDTAWRRPADRTARAEQTHRRFNMIPSDFRSQFDRFGGRMANELIRVAIAARRLGVSYATLKQWIYKGTLAPCRPPAATIGYRSRARAVPRAERPGTLLRRSSRQTRADGARALSGRNQLRGVVEEVRTDGLMARFACASATCSPPSSRATRSTRCG